MAYSKKSHQDEERKLANLQAIKRDLEQGTTIRESKRVIAAWKYWMKLAEEKRFDEQEKIRKEWEDYYAAVKETNAYRLYQEQRKALALGDLTRVKELAIEAKQMREEGLTPELTEPTSVDPAIFIHGDIVNRYREIQGKIDALVRGEEPNDIFQ